MKGDEEDAWGPNRPFIYADLRKYYILPCILCYIPLASALHRFLPSWCDDMVKVSIDDDKGIATESKPKAGSSCTRSIKCAVLVSCQGKYKFLDVATWQLAWDRYALVAAALGQIRFSEAMLHKATVMEVLPRILLSCLNSRTHIYVRSHAKLTPKTFVNRY